MYYVKFNNIRWQTDRKIYYEFMNLEFQILVHLYKVLKIRNQRGFYKLLTLIKTQVMNPCNIQVPG